MNKKEHLQTIDDFFENISTEEFDELLIRAGICNINSSKEFDMDSLQVPDE